MTVEFAWKKKGGIHKVLQRINLKHQNKAEIFAITEIVWFWNRNINISETG